MTTTAPALDAPDAQDAQDAPVEHPRSQTTLWLAAIAVLAVVATVAAVLLLRYPSEDAPEEASSAPAQERAELDAFKEALRPLTDRGAHVVAVGIKPGMADIKDERYPPDVLTTMVNGWIAELESVRRDLDGTEHPSFLDDAHWLYLRSLDGYLNTATALRAAVAADEAHEQELLDLAASLGRAADTLYDQADDLVGREQARIDRSAKEK